EIAKIVLDGTAQFVARIGGQPFGLVVAPRADLGDDDEVVRVRMQGFANDAVGDVRAVEIAGVDVVDAARHRLAQHGYGFGTVPGRTVDAGSGQLHGAVAEATDPAVAESEGSGFFDVGHGCLLACRPPDNACAIA